MIYADYTNTILIRIVLNITHVYVFPKNDMNLIFKFIIILLKL